LPHNGESSAIVFPKRAGIDCRQADGYGSPQFIVALNRGRIWVSRLGSAGSHVDIDSIAAVPKIGVE
jgi:hypothetical protein